MRIVGTFKALEEGFVGEIRTHGISIKGVRLIARPISSTDVEYSIRSRRREIGSGWEELLDGTERTYMVVKFTDPTLRSIATCHMVETDSDVLALVRGKFPD